MSQAQNTMNVPAHIMARVQNRGGQKSAVMAAVASDGFAYPKISTKASRYRLVDDGTETVIGATVDVVIVGASPYIAKQYYGRPYDPNDTAPPDCWSNDGKYPDAAVPTPVSQNCSSCPHNVLGSKVNPSGAKSKMCADQRHLAVVPAADPTKVYGLTVPVSGMKALREYFRELGNYGLIPEEVVTQLGFDDDASYPKITFTHKGFVPEKALSMVEDIAASDAVKVATRLAAPSSAPALPPAASTEAAPAAAPAPAPARAPKAAAPKPQLVQPAPAAAPQQAAPAPAATVAATPPSEVVTALESKLHSLFSED